jgi:hypothetical protein
MEIYFISECLPLTKKPLEDWPVLFQHFIQSMYNKVSSHLNISIGEYIEWRKSCEYNTLIDILWTNVGLRGYNIRSWMTASTNTSYKDNVIDHTYETTNIWTK